MATPQQPVRSAIEDFPQELIEAVCARIFYAGIPTFISSLDPLIGAPHPPTGLPNSFPAASWTDHSVRKTLASLCMVNKAWYYAAKPQLWRRLEVRLPRSWLCLVDELAGGTDREARAEETAIVVGKSLQEAQNAALAVRSIFVKDTDESTAEKLHSDIMARLDGSVPPELLSPPASRDPSPWRLRGKSPARWRLLKSISDAVQNVMSLGEDGIYVPPVYDPRPGRFVQHVDFNHFRTIGMRRSVEEGVSSRFVTAERLEAILKEAPNLKTFGATEYMDGALNLAVIKELFLRGSASLPGRGRVTRSRFDAITEEDIEERERRSVCVELEAMDFTGCISAVFVNALTEFVNTFLIGPNETEADDEESRGRHGRFVEEPLTFPSVQRLCLRGAKSIPSNILNHFVLALPSLTHLDLSATRVTPEVLATLGSSGRMHLHSLSLAKCIRLTGQSICNFLIDSSAARELKELNLYGDSTFFTPLTADELKDLVQHAPCFTKGELEYLDISSAPLSPAILEVFPKQPKLRSLGLSFMPALPLDAIAKFLTTKATNVEVLTLVSTSPDLGYGAGAGITHCQASRALHSKIIRPLSTPPFSFSLTSSSGASAKSPTNLRVVELASPMLSGLGAGAGSWRIIRSKGGRGWYVDTASGWCGGELKRNLEDNHPWKEELQRLSDANGNVASGVGWHARKMEVLCGHGMFGREDGLYGAVSFAYQG